MVIQNSCCLQNLSVYSPEKKEQKWDERPKAFAEADMSHTYAGVGLHFTFEFWF